MYPLILSPKAKKHQLWDRLNHFSQQDWLSRLREWVRKSGHQTIWLQWLLDSIREIYFVTILLTFYLPLSQYRAIIPAATASWTTWKKLRHVSLIVWPQDSGNLWSNSDRYQKHGLDRNCWIEYYTSNNTSYTVISAPPLL